jgi:tetratricopeptide (TPR) repeat protein
MNSRKWSDEDADWLKMNFGRMDLQRLSHELRFPLEEVEKRIKDLKLLGHEGNAGKHRAPTSLKEAVRELSAARRDYERAIELFHKRQFDEAAKRFEDLIQNHPDEKELADRARMYLTASRNGKRNNTTPDEPEEIYHAAVFEKNRGNVDKALELLKKSASRRDGDGRVHYLAACCHALAGQPEQALADLKKAILADGQNRIHARLEADLSSLKGTAGFSELLAG